MAEHATVRRPVLGILERVGADLEYDPDEPQQARSLEWAAIIGGAMLAAMRFLPAEEVLSRYRLVADDPMLQLAVVAAAHAGVRSLDIFWMLE